VGEAAPLINLPLGGYTLVIDYSVVAQWVIMLIIIAAVLVFTRKLETVPKGSQIWVETIVEKIQGLVIGNMGEGYKNYVPYIGTMMIYLLMLNLVGLVGFRPPTTDYSVTLALALISFIVIQGTAIKKNGFGHYLSGYTQPYSFMLPLNLIERFVVPVSLSLRLFGNITAATIMVELLYEGLEFFSHALHLPEQLPIFQAIIPVPFHMYFDIFDGSIQMFIFTMLSMIFIKTTSEH
jgi:F-type H+-transporting ATPase subunit a